MPAHINYETTPIIFYKFVCENPEIKSCYVGQTTNFQQRKNSHKSRCNSKINNKNYNLKIYETIRENEGFDKWKMVEIGRQLCLDKSDACKIEQKYIEELQADMNTYKAVQWSAQTYVKYHKQYTIDNKEKILEKCKQYRLNNIEKINKHNNCECGGNYLYRNFARHLKSQKHQNYLATINNIDIIQNDA